jgi:nucleoside-diphosphate-sugar epimerase
VPDITTPGAFDEVIKAAPPFDVVLHQASPFLFKVADDNESDFLVPAVKGTEEILKGIKAYAPSVRRVVLTSSCAAVLDWKAGDDGKVYTEEDWNPTTWEEALNGDKGEAYRGSKKYAEKAGKSDCIVKFLLA